jgi:hypothetical protein
MNIAVSGEGVMNMRSGLFMAREQDSVGGFFVDSPNIPFIKKK